MNYSYRCIPGLFWLLAVTAFLFSFTPASRAGEAHTLVIVSHPYPGQSVMTNGLEDAARSVPGVTVRNLEALYGFDSRNQMLCGYYAFGEFDYARENLRLLALSQREDGLLELCAPARVPVNIPSFSLAFIIALEEYCRYSGDLAFGEEMLETADKILDSLRGHIHNGTAFCYQEPGYWNFYEWNELLDGQPMEHESPVPPSADAGLQLFGLLALQRMAALYGYLGRDAGALIQECRTLAEGLEAFWDEENGAYASFLRDNQSREGLSCGRGFAKAAGWLQH